MNGVDFNKKCICKTSLNQSLIRSAPSIKPWDNVVEHSKNPIIRFTFKNAVKPSIVELKSFVTAGRLVIQVLTHARICHSIVCSMKNEHWGCHLQVLYIQTVNSFRQSWKTWWCFVDKLGYVLTLSTCCSMYFVAFKSSTAVFTRVLSE